jgi:hypothetical protein
MVAQEVRDKVLELDRSFRQLYYRPSKYDRPDHKLVEFAEDLNNLPEVDYNYAYYLVEMLATKLGYDFNVVYLLKDLDFGGKITNTEWYKIVRADRKRRINGRYNNVQRDRV